MTTGIIVFMFLVLVGFGLLIVVTQILVLRRLKDFMEQIGMWLLTEAAARGALQKAAMDLTEESVKEYLGTPAWPGRRKAGETT